jgi:hypothetical protein
MYASSLLPIRSPGAYLQQSGHLLGGRRSRDGRLIDVVRSQNADTCDCHCLLAEPSCYRPSWWCSHDTAVLENLDCDGDGMLDFTCKDNWGNRWALLSSLGCDTNRDFSGSAPRSVCPLSFTPVKVFNGPPQGAWPQVPGSPVTSLRAPPACVIALACVALNTKSYANRCTPT